MRLARNIYHRKDGRFEARYACGKTAEGKTKYRSVFGKSYAEVKEKLEQARSEGETPKPIANPLTIAGAVEAHLNSEAVRLKPSTLGVYRRYLECYIAPHFGKTRCDALTAELSQNFVNALIRNGLAVVTVQSIFNLLKSSLEAANGDVFKVDFPKRRKQQADFFSVEEQKRIEQAAKNRDRNDYIAVMLCLYTGIRIGEAAGLRWSDVIFERKSLQINQTLQRIRTDGSSESKTELAFLAPKSETSAREIPLPDFLFEILQDWKRKSKTEYVLTYKGKPIEPRTLQNRFKRILEAAEVKEVNFHVMRHSFAVRALQTGTDVKSLSEILGHSTATVTLNKYAHSDTGHKRDCMNALSEIYSSG